MATNNKRVIFYVTSFEDLAPLVSAAQDGYATHALIGLFHLGYNDPGKTDPYIHLNNIVPSDPSLDELWSTVPKLQALGMRVMGSMGGGGVGDFGNLFSNYDVFYPILRTTLEKYNLDGLDLDIEEWGITTENVQQLVSDLRKDFGSHSGGFAITSAPVASALTGGGSVSGGINYNTLLPQFDWYNIQFYNGWGDLQNGSSSAPPNFDPNYPGVIASCGVANAPKLVAGVPTNPNSGSGYISLANLTPIIASLVATYPQFGGVDGWNYQNALDSQGLLDPLGWAESIAEAQTVSEVSS